MEVTVKQQQQLRFYRATHA